MQALESGGRRKPQKEGQLSIVPELALLETELSYQEAVKSLLISITDTVNRIEALTDLVERFYKSGQHQRHSELYDAIKQELAEQKRILSLEVFPPQVREIRSTLDVILPEGNTPTKLRTLRAVHDLDQLCGYPKRKRPADPSRGILFFDRLPAAAVVELAECLLPLKLEQDERKKAAFVISELMGEIAMIVESPDMMGKIASKEGRTFILTLHEAIQSAPRIIDIARPPMNTRTVKMLLEIIARVDEFSDLDKLMTEPVTLEPVVGEIVVAMNLREKVVPEFKQQVMRDLRSSRELIAAYRSYVVPEYVTDGIDFDNIEKKVVVVEKLAERVSPEDIEFTAYYNFNHELSVLSSLILRSISRKIIEVYKRKGEVDEERRRLKQLEVSVDQTEAAVEDEVSVKQQKGIPEIKLPDLVRVKDILNGDEQIEQRKLRNLLLQLEERFGTAFSQDYRLELLAPTELQELAEILFLPNSHQAMDLIGRKSMEMEKWVETYPGESGNFPVEEIRQFNRIFKSGSTTARQTLSQGKLIKKVLSALISFESFQVQNKRFRNRRLPEPFEDLPLPYLQTEMYLGQVVGDSHAVQETKACLENIQHFVAYDADLLRTKKLLRDQRHTMGLDKVIAKLKDLGEGYGRRGYLTYKQRLFVNSLCREYQRNVFKIL